MAKLQTPQGRSGVFPMSSSPFFGHVETADEQSIIDIFEAVGAVRGANPAHQNSGSQPENADFIIGNTAIELKIFNSDGITSNESRAKIADLFKPIFPDYPVIPVDHNLLNGIDLSKYQNAVGATIIRAIQKANNQLKQTRSDNASLELSVVMVVNNYGRAFDNEQFKDICIKGLRKGSHIDGVITATLDIHSDGFVFYTLPRFEYHGRNGEDTFPEFELLKDAWDGYAMRLMNQSMRGDANENNRNLPTKGSHSNLVFDHDSITYVLPAPNIGPSGMFPSGRPRMDSDPDRSYSSLSTIAPGPQRLQFQMLKRYLQTNNAAAYEAKIQSAKRTSVKPFIIVRDFRGWKRWLRDNQLAASYETLCAYADYVASAHIIHIADNPCVVDSEDDIPIGSVTLITTPIGMDTANDVCQVVFSGPVQDDSWSYTELQPPIRCHETYAPNIAAAWAVSIGHDVIYHIRDNRFLWK